MSGPVYSQQQIAWLQLVDYYSQSGSAESQQTLAELANNAPFDPMDVEVQTLVNKVKKVAENKAYDPRLSPESKGLLNGISNMQIDRTVGPKPPCVKRLNFDNIDPNTPW